MDPWAVVDLADGTQLLFGFAVEHPDTGGLSWVLSTPIIKLDDRSGAAWTRSGRHYRLDRRITAAQLPTEEARLAFTLLAAPYELEDDSVPCVLISNMEIARVWVSTCKMARHLQMEPPPLHDPAAIRAFVERNLERYLIARSGQRLS